MSHFNNANFANFREDMRKQNCEVFTIVRNKGTGEISMTGNNKMAMECLSDAARVERRCSRQWVPDKPFPEPPVHFEQLAVDQKGLRGYASTLLRHFLENKQKIGQVS